MHVSNIKKSLSIVSTALILFSYIITSGVLIFRPQVARAATITVTNTNDSGAGSLRQAILDANASVGVPDTIEFAIPGPGPHTIQPTSTLPTITDQVTIDGTTQSGWVANTAVAPNPFNGTMMIELDGQNTVGPNDNGLSFIAGSDGSVVRGMVINRFNFDGIYLTDINGATVAGNYIGTSVDGLTDLGNGARGVGTNTSVITNNVTVGGLNPTDRNILSGNSDGGGPNGNEGISVCASCDGWIIQGNYIGLGSDGITIIANETAGVASATAINTTFGGNLSGSSNVISGNGSGVIMGNSAIFTNNIVGTDYTGILNKANSTYGLLVVGNDSQIQNNNVQYNTYGGVLLAGNNILVGGINPGDGNIIINNGLGIGVTSLVGSNGLNNSILRNTIYSNTGGPISTLGIDLLGNTNDTVTFTNAGVTPNDANDPDITSNHLMNFPVINSITSSNGQVTINYDLDINDAEAGATGYRVEFFANDAADPSGYGEGQTFLGYENIAGDVTGQSVTLTLPAGVEGNKFISATTTMTDNSTDGFGHTSEFGALVEANLVPTGSVTPAPAATLASTGRNSSLLLLISFMVVATGGVGLYRAIYKSSNSPIDRK